MAPTDPGKRRTEDNERLPGKRTGSSVLEGGGGRENLHPTETEVRSV